MRHDDPNLSALRTIARALEPLTDQLVFVGGAVAGLLVTDPLADTVRATYDVDAIVQARRGQYQHLEGQVAALGFRHDVESGVNCRWVHRDSGIVFDLMPVEEDVLGFSNRWYSYAVETARMQDLGDGLSIRLVTAVAFVATKLEAFADRGRSDVLISHDLEDILNIVDGRQEMVEEVRASPVELREAIGRAFAGLLADSDFLNALPGLIADSTRSDIVLGRLREMVG